MPLHPQAQGLVDLIAQTGGPALYELEPDAAREAAMLFLDLIGAGPEVASVADVAIEVPGGSIGARLYAPVDGLDAVVVYLHGGGWVLGNVDWVDAVCRRLTNASRCRVLSVDYRLAPEFTFPTAADDAFAAVRWAADELAPTAGLVVAGDSAGGNLAAVCARRARDSGAPRIDLQVLVYPVTDHDFTTASYLEHGDSGYPLGRREMEWFWELYAPPERRDDPDVSPLRAPSLAGLPPAIVLIDEYDPLRDEGLAYAERLRDEGVSVDLIRIDDMTHGFFTMVNYFERADEAVDLVGARMHAALQPDLRPV